jgi:hypothetical protein
MMIEPCICNFDCFTRQDFNGYYWVQCPNSRGGCGIGSTEGYLVEERAIEKWNKRIQEFKTFSGIRGFRTLK